MGNFCGSCFKGNEPDLVTPEAAPRRNNFKRNETDSITPDAETRRNQLAMAAERRLEQQESRGIKNPENFKRNQQKAIERERMEREAGATGGSNLRWTQD